MAEIVKLKNIAPKPNLGLNKFKWVMLFVVFIVALFANYHFAVIPNSIRLIIWLVIAIGLFALFAWTIQGQKFLIFAKAARNEMRKVTWPTRQETTQSCIAVVALVAILALLLWLIDTLWFWLITLVTG